MNNLKDKLALITGASFSNQTNIVNQTTNTRQNNNEKFVIPKLNQLDPSLIDKTITFQDTQNRTYDELKSFYGSRETQQNIRNSYLSTMFSSDMDLSSILFNQVNDMTEAQGTNYLANLFTHKNISLNTQNDSSQKGKLLRQSIMEMIDDKDIKATQEKLEKEFNTTMQRFDIMEHMNSMLDFGKDAKEKSKNSENSFLYNDFYDQYSTLIDKYKHIKQINSNIIKQY